MRGWRPSPDTRPGAAPPGIYHGRRFSFLIHAGFLKILAYSAFRVRISTGPINGGHTGQSFQPDIPSQEPNLIVTRSYLSQLFTDRIEHL